MAGAFAELRAADVPVTTSCALTGRSKATHYRRLGMRGPVHGPRPRRRPPPHALDAAERAQVLEVLTSHAYRDLAIPQVWARELDEGRYRCSVSTMYRIARAAGQVHCHADSAICHVFGRSFIVYATSCAASTDSPSASAQANTVSSSGKSGRVPESAKRCLPGPR
jgi:hypothetical protein